MIRDAIRTAVSGDPLTGAQMAGAMETILAGEASPAQIAA
ncbi:MAG TPA: anthranilate phosphoribosyltransferase, partial [Myxococcales bacterium]|nr:anthranilate phosphoribosyltransferase [Myxococcales bacterium]